MRARKKSYLGVAVLLVLLASTGCVYAKTGVEYGFYELRTRAAGPSSALFAAPSMDVAVKPRDSSDPPGAYHWKFVGIPGLSRVYQIESVEHPNQCLAVPSGGSSDDRIALAPSDPSDVDQHWTLYGLMSGYRILCPPGRNNDPLSKHYRRPLEVITVENQGLFLRPFEAITQSARWKLHFPQPVQQDWQVIWQPDESTPSIGAAQEFEDLGVVGLDLADLDDTNLLDLIVGWEQEGVLAYSVGWNLTNAGYPQHWRAEAYPVNQHGERYHLPWLEPGAPRFPPHGGVALANLMGSDQLDLVYFVVGYEREECGFVVGPDLNDEGILNGAASWYPYPELAWLPFDHSVEPDDIEIKGVGFAVCSVSDAVGGASESTDFLCCFVYDWLGNDDGDLAAYVLLQNVQIADWEGLREEKFEDEDERKVRETWENFYINIGIQVHSMPGAIGTKDCRGAGVAVADLIQGDDSDILIYVVDAAGTDRRGRYIIGADMDLQGAVGAGDWTPWTWANEVVLPYVAPFGFTGSHTSGAGATIGDLDNDGSLMNPNLEFIYIHADSGSGESRLTFGTLWVIP